MLDTFRRRDNARAATPGAPNSRTPVAGPQGRIAEGSGDTGRFERLATAPTLADTPKPVTPALEPPAAARPVERGARESARLTVGPDIKLQGAQISDCDTLIVEGQVDACMDSRVVEVAEHGIFRGKVQVESAEIRGRFEGELTAHRQLTIRAGGRVTGKIRYGKLLVDEGGEISGDIAAAASAAADVLAHDASISADQRGPAKADESTRAQEESAVTGTPYRSPGTAATR